MIRGGSSRLSRQECAVFVALAGGQSTDQIADDLCVSPHTVRTHVKNGMRKLSAKTRAHAVAIALSQGVIELPAEDEADAA
jgi:DNA-binding CsgD family transcriptional regulator